MKNLTLLILLVLTFSSSAQIGIITIKEKDPVYYDQWYTYKKTHNMVWYCNTTPIVDSMINTLLEDYTISFDDGILDEDDMVFWQVDNDNGFTSRIYTVKSILLM